MLSKTRIFSAVIAALSLLLVLGCGQIFVRLVFPYNAPVRSHSLGQTGRLSDSATSLLCFEGSSYERRNQRHRVGHVPPGGGRCFCDSRNRRLFEDNRSALALEHKTPNTMEVINQRMADLVINIPKNFQKDELTNDYLIRRSRPA